VNWLFWAPLGAASLHLFEEFVFPGGFPSWYRGYAAGRRESITTRFLVIVNLLLLIVCYDIGALGPTPAGVALWLTVMALLAANAGWHVAAAIRSRSYSPGLVTGLALYAPLAVYGYARFIGSGQASVPTAGLAFAIGASYQLWSNAFHRWRARRAKA